MNRTFEVPDDAVKYILLQRTDLLKFPKTKIYKIVDQLIPWEIYGSIASLESTFRSQSIKQKFCEIIFSEYENIKSFLPSQCTSIVDIGCGAAGIDVFLYRHYKISHSDLKFYLLDKTKIDKKIYYGFKKETAFYNSLEASKKMLSVNGVLERNIAVLEADSEADLKSIKKESVDLAFSLISWGYHYPVSTYLDRVYEILNPGGHLIMDVRRHTQGKKEIKEKFGDIKIIFEDERQVRILAVK